MKRQLNSIIVDPHILEKYERFRLYCSSEIDVDKVKDIHLLVTRK